MFSIRLATKSDIDALVALDVMAQHNSQRCAFITRSVEAGNCSAVTDKERVVGYGVLEYSFFEQGFVSMLYIHPDFRRRGAGARLMQHLESLCQTAKLFTSTNLSNVPMQSLLNKLGYILSGVIQHLDEDDPELVYVKYIGPGAS